jgi:hypothetical protein
MGVSPVVHADSAPPYCHFGVDHNLVCPGDRATDGPAAWIVLCVLGVVLLVMALGSLYVLRPLKKEGSAAFQSHPLETKDKVHLND